MIYSSAEYKKKGKRAPRYKNPFKTEGRPSSWRKQGAYVNQAEAQQFCTQQDNSPQADSIVAPQGEENPQFYFIPNPVPDSPQ